MRLCCLLRLRISMTSTAERLEGWDDTTSKIRRPSSSGRDALNEVRCNIGFGIMSPLKDIWQTRQGARLLVLDPFENTSSY
jgi:hypothetical protein